MRRKKGQADFGSCAGSFGDIKTCMPPLGGISALRMYRPVFAKGDFLINQIEFYQKHIDPELKKRYHVKRICRYEPTCSEYAKQAIKKHRIMGIFLAIFRLLRCNPFSKGGYDPVR